MSTTSTNTSFDSLANFPPGIRGATVVVEEETGFSVWSNESGAWNCLERHLDADRPESDLVDLLLDAFPAYTDLIGFLGREARWCAPPNPSNAGAGVVEIVEALRRRGLTDAWFCRLESAVPWSLRTRVRRLRRRFLDP